MFHAGRIAAAAAVWAACLLALAVPARAAEPTKAIVWEHFASKHTTEPEVWIANPDGSGARKVARGEQPDISPDGRWVAYTSSATGEHRLYVVPSGGGKPRVAFSPHDYVIPHSFDWSADSTRIFFGGEGYDGWLVGAYDVNSGRSVVVDSSLRPFQVALVPGSNHLVVLQDENQLFLVNSENRLVRPIAEFYQSLADRVLVSPTTLAFRIFTGRRTSPGLDSFVKATELRTVDLGSGIQRKFSAGLAPIGWSADQRRLDVSQATCSKRRCTSRVATLDPASGILSPGIPLGKTTVRIRTLRGRSPGRRKKRVTTVRSSGLDPIAYSTDGTSLLALRARVLARGRTLNDALLEADAQIPLIVSVPRAGGPGTSIARGRNPDWNL